MTPKEKAKELIKKIEDADLVDSTDWGGCAFLDVKKCALIAVDEIIDTIKTTPGGYFMTIYWKDVKKEIELL